MISRHVVATTGAVDGYRAIVQFEVGFDGRRYCRSIEYVKDGAKVADKMVPDTVVFALGALANEVILGHGVEVAR